MKIRRKMYYQPSNPRQDPLDWEFDGTTLVISSREEMPTELGNRCREWTGFRDRIRAAAIGEGITGLQQGYFAECRCLETVTLPASLREVGRAAFRGCESLRKVCIPAGCTIIGDEAFEECSRLEEVVLPPGLKCIGFEAFWNCAALREIRLPDALRMLLPGAFMGCRSLRHIRIPGTLAEIPRDAFCDCTALVSVDLEEGVREVQTSFCGCTALTDFRVPVSVRYVQPRAFLGTGVLRPMGENRGLVSGDTLYHLEGPKQDILFLPPEIRRIAGGSLAETHTECIVIPDTVEVLESYAFQRVDADVIYLGTGVRELPAEVFSGCRQLQRLYIAGTLEMAAENIGQGISSLEVITVPENLPLLKRSFGEAHEARESWFPCPEEDEEEDDTSLKYETAADASEVFRTFCREEANLLRRVYRAPVCAVTFRDVAG